MTGYESLLERVASASGLSSEEIERKIEAKRAKLSGLISKEGAAQIVAAELGVVFDNQRVQLKELMEGMKRARVLGKITQVLPVRAFSKAGREGKVGSFQLGDESSNVRVVLWDVNHIALIEQGGLKEGDVVEIGNASVRNGELHLSAFSDIKKSGEKLPNVQTARVASDGSLKDAKQGMMLNSRSFIVQLFDPKYFDAKDTGEKRALVNAVIDDGTETMRCVLGMAQLAQLGFSQEEIMSVEKFAQKKHEILGEEYIFSGTVRNNTYFNKSEFSIASAVPVDSEKLAAELEAKV